MNECKPLLGGGADTQLFAGRGLHLSTSHSPPEPFVTKIPSEHPLPPPDPSQSPRKQPLRAHPISQKVLTLS